MPRGRRAASDTTAAVVQTVFPRSQARMRLSAGDLGTAAKVVEPKAEETPVRRRGRPKKQSVPEPELLEEVETQQQVSKKRKANSEASSSSANLLLTPPPVTLSRRVSHRLRSDESEMSELTQPHFFVSCLLEDVEQTGPRSSPWHVDDFPSSSSALTTTSSSSLNIQEPSPRSLPVIVLRRALSMQVLGDECWLSSSFMDLVVTQFAKRYNNARYFSADFSRINHHIPPDGKVPSVRKKGLSNSSTASGVTDILGRVWNASFSLSKPSSSLIFFANPNNIHWTLIRVVLHPAPELQLFEPMGMPSRQNRHTGLNFRSVPKSIIDWLDATIPLGGQKSWLSIGNSVITNKHQVTSYDCGVACLLYAEKCGQGQVSFPFTS